jgi:hypothetical protein
MPVPPQVVGLDVGRELRHPRRATRPAIRRPGAGDAAIVARYSRRRKPSIRIGTMLRELTAATIPHMAESPRIQRRRNSRRTDRKLILYIRLEMNNDCNDSSRRINIPELALPWNQSPPPLTWTQSI